jgi:PHD/YefM family antitoxin component YafN of YafNO toxin-antitoxin module
MMNLHPQYITDTNGNKSMVILPVEEFDSIMEELEDIADVQLYDEAKKNDTVERISMEDAFKMIEERRKGYSKQ